MFREVRSFAPAQEIAAQKEDAEKRDGYYTEIIKGMPGGNLAPPYPGHHGQIDEQQSGDDSGTLQWFHFSSSGKTLKGHAAGSKPSSSKRRWMRRQAHASSEAYIICAGVSSGASQLVRRCPFEMRLPNRMA